MENQLIEALESEYTLLILIVTKKMVCTLLQIFADKKAHTSEDSALRGGTMYPRDWLENDGRLELRMTWRKEPCAKHLNNILMLAQKQKQLDLRPEAAHVCIGANFCLFYGYREVSPASLQHRSLAATLQDFP